MALGARRCREGSWSSGAHASGPLFGGGSPSLLGALVLTAGRFQSSWGGAHRRYR
jgi:hypothetical protein